MAKLAPGNLLARLFKIYLAASLPIIRLCLGLPNNKGLAATPRPVRARGSLSSSAWRSRSPFLGDSFQASFPQLSAGPYRPGDWVHIEDGGKTVRSRSSQTQTKKKKSE